MERIVATAKENRPAIIFFDRVDELHLDYDPVTEEIKKKGAGKHAPPGVR